MRIKLLSIILFSLNLAYAISSTEINQDLNSLVTKINQVNKDLTTKQSEKKSLSKAIDSSEEAINQSQELLGHLKQKRMLNLKQIEEIRLLLPKLSQATMEAESNVKMATVKIYQQIRALQNQESNSVFLANANLDSQRKKKYLLNLLTTQQKKYQELAVKLRELNQLSDKLETELTRFDRQLGITSKRQQQLKVEKEQKIHQAQELQQEINYEQQHLTALKKQQQELNHLLKELIAVEAKEQQKNKLAQQKQGINNKQAQAERDFENNSPLFSRKLTSPVDGVIIVRFNAMRNGLPNNGLLFKATNSSIYAISRGKVLYSGSLPGFGKMVVIDNGDNYVSIYGGVLPNVKKGDAVTPAQVIANSGTQDNQPMGGVYFELRHFGRPVNPSALVN